METPEEAAEHGSQLTWKGEKPTNLGLTRGQVFLISPENTKHLLELGATVPGGQAGYEAGCAHTELAQAASRGREA